MALTSMMGGLAGALGGSGLDSQQRHYYDVQMRHEYERRMMQQTMGGGLFNSVPKSQAEKSFREELQAETDAWLK